MENSKNYKRWYCPHHTDCMSMCCWIISPISLAVFAAVNKAILIRFDLRPRPKPKHQLSRPRPRHQSPRPRPRQ